MNSCSNCKIKKLLLFCKQCNEFFCIDCLKDKIKTGAEIHQDSIFYICEECDNAESVVFCSPCEQNLCQDCDTKIHNKGKRAAHKREPEVKQQKAFLKENKEISINKEKNRQDNSTTEQVNDTLSQKMHTSIKAKTISDNQSISSKNPKSQNQDNFEQQILNNDDMILNKEILEQQYQISLILIFQDIFEVVPFSQLTEFLKQMILDDYEKKYVFLYINMSQTYQELWKTNLQNFLLTIFQENDKLPQYQFEEILQANVEGLRLSFEESFFKQNFYNNDLKNIITGTLVGSLQDKEGIQIFLEERIKAIDLFNDHLTLYIVVEFNKNLKKQKYDEKHLEYLPCRLKKKNNKVILNKQQLPEVPEIISSEYSNFDCKLNSSFSGVLNQSMQMINPNTSYDFSSQQKMQNLNRSFQIESMQSCKTNKGKLSNFDNQLLFYQRFKSNKVCNSLNISLLIQKILFNCAESGQLMITKQGFIHTLKSFITNQKQWYTEQEQQLDVMEIVQEAELNNLLHITIRNFDSKALTVQDGSQVFVSLYLDCLTVQSLIWVLRSIKQDLMTPTEKLIQSRIKQCFKLKLNQKQWDGIIACIKRQKFVKNSGTNTILFSDYLQQVEKNIQQRFHPPQLMIKRMKDPLIGNDTQVIYFRNQEWIAEDQDDIETETDYLWKIFYDFIINFFADSKDNTQNDIWQDQEQQQQKRDSFYEFNSQSSQFKSQYFYSKSNSQTYIDSNQKSGKKDKNQNLSDDIKSIPGGRYGCAQFIKAKGPQELRKCSLGKLNLYVQEAINKEIIRYHKTLLIKNNLRHSEKEFISQKSIKQIFLLVFYLDYNELQTALIEILKEYPFGLSLAQIPQALKKKVSFKFNLQDFGLIISSIIYFILKFHQIKKFSQYFRRQSLD